MHKGKQRKEAISSYQKYYQSENSIFKKAGSATIRSFKNPSTVLSDNIPKQICRVKMNDFLNLPLFEAESVCNKKYDKVNCCKFLLSWFFQSYFWSIKFHNLSPWSNILILTLSHYHHYPYFKKRPFLMHPTNSCLLSTFFPPSCLSLITQLHIFPEKKKKGYKYQCLVYTFFSLAQAFLPSVLTHNYY